MAKLLADTGTAVTFFFTFDTDLFFAEAMLSTWRKFCVGRERRVLTFPSGLLLSRKFDLYLFAGLGLCLDSLCGFVVFIRRGEDAEWHGNSGFKVQVDDLYGRKKALLFDLSTRRKEDKKIPLASFLDELKEPGLVEAAVVTNALPGL